MTDQEHTNPGAPGSNETNWYLDMLGVRPATPAQPGPARTATTEVVFILEAPPASESTPTPLEPLERRPVAPKPAVEATPQPDLSDWRPAELAPQVTTRRPFPWGWLVSVAFLLVVVIAGLVFVPRIVENQAAEEAADYAEVIGELQSVLPGAQETLKNATEPATSGIELFDLVAQLRLVEDVSSLVAERAARPLPETFPLLPRGALDDLEPTRQRMTQLGADAATVVRRLSETITYRTTLDDILVYPSLPVRADPGQIAVVETELSETLAASATVLSDLPLDPAFTVHRDIAADAVEAFDDWRTRYVGALRAGDTTASADLIAEVRDIRAAVFSDLVPALATMRAEIDALIIAMHTTATSTIAAIPR